MQHKIRNIPTTSGRKLTTNVLPQPAPLVPQNTNLPVLIVAMQKSQTK
jgi:hypothetical protein